MTCYDCLAEIISTVTTYANPGGLSGSIPSSNYAILSDTSDAPGEKVCYACASLRDRSDAAKTGTLFAYLSENPEYDATNAYQYLYGQKFILTTWPGIRLDSSLKTKSIATSNFGDDRWYFNFSIFLNDHMESWHGIGYGGPGSYARCRRDTPRKKYTRTNRRAGQKESN